MYGFSPVSVLMLKTWNCVVTAGVDETQIRLMHVGATMFLRCSNAVTKAPAVLFKPMDCSYRHNHDESD